MRLVKWHSKRVLAVSIFRFLVFPSYLEYYRDSINPMHGKIWDHELTIENGYVFAPDRPGLGLVPK